MNLNKLWVPDPANKNRPSVSLPIMLLSIAILIIVGILQVFDIVKSTGPFLEFTYSSMALYFSRRFSFGSKVFSSEPASKVVDKIEKEEESQ